MKQPWSCPDTGMESPLPVDHPLAGLENELDALRECGRFFHARGWSTGTSSNYSVVVKREPLELLVTSSGEDKGQLSRDHFVRVDSRGRPTLDEQPKSSAETMLHVVLAQLPDTGAVMHTHSIWATLLSDHYFADGAVEISDYEMLKGLEGAVSHRTTARVPIFDNTQDIPALARQVQEMLKRPGGEPVHGFLIRNHGLYTWGRDVPSARRHVEVFEFLFEVMGRRTDFRERIGCSATAR